MDVEHKTIEGTARDNTQYMSRASAKKYMWAFVLMTCLALAGTYYVSHWIGPISVAVMAFNVGVGFSYLNYHEIFRIRSSPNSRRSAPRQ